MPELKKTIRSRASWKAKAMKRGLKGREQSKKIKRDTKKIKKLSKRISALEQQVKAYLKKSNHNS